MMYVIELSKRAQEFLDKLDKILIKELKID